MPWLAVAPLVGMVVGAVLAIVIPPISRRAGVRRAQREGAVWAGLANFDAAAHGQAPIVEGALSGVGRIYGQRLSGMRDQRPVGGHLFVFPDHIRWEPWFYLGRGKAEGLSLPRSAISGIDILKLPPPAVNSYEAVLHTVEGPIRFLVADHNGLRRALN